jgi:hypothetical protein
MALKCLVINRPERSDRRIAMEKHLTGMGLEWEMIPALNSHVPAGGFQNLSTRGIFWNHLECWERIAKDRRRYLILEDDARILDLGKVEERYATVTTIPVWHALYLYGGDTWLPRIHAGATHGYFINPDRAPEMVRMLIQQEREIYVTGKKDWQSHIDHWLDQKIWRAGWRCHGSEELIVQEAGWGSDTGWRQGRVEP